MRWQANLTRTQFPTFMYSQAQPGSNAPRFPYQTVGHAIVLNVGHMVFGLDPVNQKVLWEKSLLGASGLPASSQVTPDPRDGTLQILYQDGWVQRLGSRARPRSGRAVSRTPSRW